MRDSIASVTIHIEKEMYPAAPFVRGTAANISPKENAMPDAINSQKLMA
jgi:hypothetical protein